MDNAVSGVSTPATVAAAPVTLAGLAKSPAIVARFNELLKDRAAAFISTVLTAANQNVMLKMADPMTVLTAAMTAAALDLPISAGLGFAALVPYKERGGRTVCQLQLMARGYVQLALRSNQFLTINVADVRAGEIAAVNKFTGEFIFAERTTEEIVGYMAYIRLKNGFEKYLYMTNEEIKTHAEKYSQTAKKGFGLWVDNYDAMARKTVLKLLLSRWGVLSPAMQTAIQRDGVATVNLDDIGQQPLQSEYVDSARNATE